MQGHTTTHVVMDGVVKDARPYHYTWYDGWCGEGCKGARPYHCTWCDGWCGEGCGGWCGEGCERVWKTSKYWFTDITQSTGIACCLSCVAVTASLKDSWVSLMIWSAQRSGGMEARMLMIWVPGCRLHLCPKAPRRSLRIIVIRGVLCG